jgi:hypothetical protein
MRRYDSNLGNAVLIIRTSISSQLQRGEADKRKQERNDPEPDHDLRLGPTQVLEVMVERRHFEHLPAGDVERDHLPRTCCSALHFKVECNRERCYEPMQNSVALAVNS